MNVLLVGSGGREHAIAWKLRQSPQLDKLFVAPGNAGIARLPNTQIVPIAATSLDELVEFARDNAIDLTIVGPEAPLVAGIVDRFQQAGLRIFGPSQAAAQLEGSKAFSKRFMQKYKIPTGRAEIFSDFDEAVRYMRGITGIPVIKASGLAAGKGVIVPYTREEAADALQMMLLDRVFGDAGDTILIEEKLSGPEVSILAFCDGTRAQILPTAQDHKRLLDDDRGPNTGGMGAFAPSGLMNPELLTHIEKEIVLPTLAGMRAEGTPFVGVLFIGLMLTPQGPKVLEYNVRLGDPETQVILPLLENDLLDLLNACVDGALDRATLRWRKESAVTVVLAAHGYPGQIATGHPIYGLEEAEKLGCLVFHAGTKLGGGGSVLTNGGRVLAVTALGKSKAKAAALAYEGVTQINFAGAQFRNDIGRQLPAELRIAKRSASGRNTAKSDRPGNANRRSTRAATGKNRPTTATEAPARKITRGKMALRRRRNYSDSQ